MERTVTIKNAEGLHARPAGILVKAASAFTADIDLIVGETNVNAKSIMSVMSLGLTMDEEVLIRANGTDADMAVTKLCALVENQFQA